jgi:HEAT repeat protein
VHRKVVLVFSFAALACGSCLQAEEPAAQSLVGMVIELLGDEDPEVRGLAYEQVRENALGETATLQFADVLPRLSSPAMIGLIAALAERGDSVARPAVTAVVSTHSAALVRSAAIRALGKLGTVDDIPLLLELLTEGPESTRVPARESLVELRGRDVVLALTSHLSEGDTRTRIALAEVLAARHAVVAIPTLLDLAVSGEVKVRSAAMVALGKLAGPEHLGGMTQGVLAAEEGVERSTAEKHLMFVCNRLPDKDRRAAPLRAVMQALTETDRLVMLSTLGRIGGESALEEVSEALASSQPAIHAAGIQAISNWPDASVAAKLIELAKSDEHERHRRIARMALLRIAPLPDGRPDAEKVELLKVGMELAADDAERNYALSRAAAIRTVETLRLILPFLSREVHVEAACEAIVELAHHRKLRNQNKQEFQVALDLVLETTKNPVVQERALRYKQGQTWARPKQAAR